MLGPILAALLAVAPGSSPRDELDALAARIEQLKVRRLAGENVDRELERLLVRAQEIASRLEPRAPGPLPRAGAGVVDELQESIDALHDEADRLAEALAMLDVRIADARRLAAVEAGGAGLARGAAAGAGSRASAAAVRLSGLLEERIRVAARLAEVRAAAAALQAEAADGR